MMTKEEDKGGQNGAPVTPKLLRRLWETGEKLKKSCFNPGLILSTLRVSAFAETEHSMSLSELSQGEAYDTGWHSRTAVENDLQPGLWLRREMLELTFPRGFGANDVKRLGSLFDPWMRWNLPPNISFQNILWPYGHVCTHRIGYVCETLYFALHFIILLFWLIWSTYVFLTIAY